MADPAFSIVIKNASSVAKSIKNRNDIAAFRTVNALEKKSQASLGKTLRQIYPVKQKQIKSAIKLTKAKKTLPTAKWRISGQRLNLANPRKTAKGISFVGLYKRRHKVNEHINGGSKPFMIHGQYSGRMTAVYRDAGVSTWATPKKRNHVTTMKGHTMPYLFDKINSMKHIRVIFKRSFKAEYSRQLDRAKF